MSDETTLRVGVEADADNAVRDMRAAASAASDLADSFREIAGVAVKAAQAMNRIEKSQAGVSSGQKRIAQSVSEATQNIQEQANAATKLSSALRNVGNISGTNTGTKVSTGVTAGRPDIGVVSKQDRASLAASQAAREAAERITQQHVTEIARREMQERVKINAEETRQWVAQQKARSAAATPAANRTNVGSSFGTIEPDAIKATRAMAGFNESLFTARFALHDISNATTVAGAALIGFNAYAVNAAADYETALASIQRTSGATASQMGVIRDEFVALAQEVPAGFQNIAQIGELAGQLNIPAGQIADFTNVVAQFTASTDVAVQASAEAFGRLDTLLPDVQGNYEALGSSILNVGVNSVATESQIISTTTQIAAAGAQAGFSADQVIGLAASFASLGVAPEAARGSVIRIFSEIRTATVEGGANLEEFARLAGQSADQFRQSWAESPDTAFLSFLQGLQREGANAEASLRAMGISGVRDINALLRLSQNLDIVQQSFGYANAGFEQGTQLAEAYGITAQTLNARLDVLGQAFQAMFAELGAGSTGPLKEFVNLTIDAIKAMTDLARNPAAQWIAAFGAIFTLLAGGALVITGLVARMGAAAISMRTVNKELRELAFNAASSGTAMGALQGRVAGAAASLTTFGAVAKGLAFATVITAGITIAIGAIQAFTEATKSAGDRAREAFGDLSGLSNAISSDEKVFQETGEAIGFVEGKLTTVSKKSADWVEAVNSATGAQTGLAGAADQTTQSVEDQTFAIGKNTAAWLAQQLANNDAVVNAIKRNEELRQSGMPTADIGGIISATVANDTTKALALIDDYDRRVQEFIRVQSEQSGEISGALSGSIDGLLAQGEALRSITDLTSGALGEAAARITITEAVNGALGVSAQEAAGGLAEMGEEASSTASRIEAMRESVEGLFNDQNLIGQFGADLAKLFSGIYDGGAAFDALSSAGFTNLQNLQSALVSTIAAGETMGVSATQSVAALFIQLQKSGVDTANLLASLSSIRIPGLNIGGVKAILADQSKLTGNSAKLSQAMNGIAASAPRAAKGLSGAGKGAKQAAAEVRTLTDYAGDLAKVFDRAFEIRFGAAQGVDKITSEFLEMRQTLDDANKTIAETQVSIRDLNQSISEANAEINGLNVDNSILRYFEQVAIAYGDTLRAADIASEIGKNDQAIADNRNKIADSNTKIAEEQAKATQAAGAFDKNLEGNSANAIKNREQILGLVSNYQDLIQSYAAAGYDQAQLNAKTQELKNQFLAQAQQLGFNTAQLGTYAVAFDDVTLAIGRVPRNITVTANTNPAMQALNEFIAAASRASANVNVGSGGNDYNNGYNAGALYSDGWVKAANAGRSIRQIVDRNVPGGYLYQTVDRYGNGGPKFFSKGGYTGGGGRNDEAGIVHGQEFVINAKNTSRLGLGFLNALNSGRTPVPSGGSGIQIVELSAYDRSLLAAAGNVQITIPGQAIAGAANSANFVAASRGSN